VSYFVTLMVIEARAVLIVADQGGNKVAEVPVVVDATAETIQAVLDACRREDHAREKRKAMGG
jgi:hypothetical protein